MGQVRHGERHDHARRQNCNNEGLPAIGSRAGPNDRKLRSRS
jgi:hypothetical protein